MTVQFHPRSQLGLGFPVLSRLALRTPNEVGALHRGLTFHHTGSDGTLYKPDPIARLRGIFTYHVVTLGYGDIAYEGAFDADGNTYGLRDARYVGAHAASTDNVANRRTDGIVFLEDRRGITPDALHAFSWWVDLYRLAHGRTPLLWAHEWWGRLGGGKPTECPGPQLRDVVGFCGGFV